MDIKTVRSQIEKHLGKAPNKLFKSFDETPLGSASIAQVHKATLQDGTIVAVKVRRPNVVETVARDFALIEKAVLTEDFIIGNEVSDNEFLKTLSNKKREQMVTLIADNFATQVLTDGFYHADPHSGNVLIKDADIQWIDFGMMGTLTSKQRQTLLDIVTNIVMQDAYGLKRTLMQIAHPKGEINHGKTLELCEEMCGQYNGADFGDFDLGDLLSTVLNNLQDANFKVDPFLTNLARGIVAVEGTIKTLSPKVNILNFFTDKVYIGLDLSFDSENLKEMNPEVAKRLMQLFKGVTDSSVKTAETLNMLEKWQIKVCTDFSLEEKTLTAVNRIASYAIRALIISALFIGSGLLCIASGTMNSNETTAVVFRAIGFFGFAISAFCAFMLYRNIRKNQ